MLVGTKLYLSKIDLDPTRAGVQDALANPWLMHAAVAKTVGVGRQEAGRGLYRLEHKPGVRPYLLVQSPVEPDFSPLKEAGFAAAVATKRFAPSDIEPGTILEFRTFVVASFSRSDSRAVKDKSALDIELAELKKVNAAMPIMEVDRLWTQHGRDGSKIGWKVKFKDGTSLRVGRQASRPRFAVKDDGIESWLKKELVGAELVDWVEARAETVTATRFTRRDDPGEKLVWQARLILGNLRVVDSAAFSSTLAFGIGRARGFGLGLVSVAAARGF